MSDNRRPDGRTAIRRWRSTRAYSSSLHVLRHSLGNKFVIMCTGLKLNCVKEFLLAVRKLLPLMPSQIKWYTSSARIHAQRKYLILEHRFHFESYCIDHNLFSVLSVCVLFMFTSGAYLLCNSHKTKRNETLDSIMLILNILSWMLN